MVYLRNNIIALNLIQPHKNRFKLSYQEISHPILSFKKKVTFLRNNGWCFRKEKKCKIVIKK